MVGIKSDFCNKIACNIWDFCIAEKLDDLGNKQSRTLNDSTDWQLNSELFNLLGADFTKWSNTLKQFVGKLPTNSLGVFYHFVGLALKGLRNIMKNP